MNNIPVIDISRLDVLNFLPSGVVAEVGVAKGVFSEIIIKINKPKKLYLIDVWDLISLSYDNYNMLEANEQIKRYNLVKRKFSNIKTVQIIKNKSDEAANLIDHDSLDWVYIDADHSYEGCYNDLISYDKKVKYDGYILGHDFSFENFEKKGYGVKLAVNKFIKENNYIFSFLTLDQSKTIKLNEKLLPYRYGSFVISKNMKLHRKLIEKINDKLQILSKKH